MLLSTWRMVVASVLSFVFGIAAAAGLGPVIAGLWAPAEAAPNAELGCGVADGFTLGGSWSSGGRLNSDSVAKIDPNASFEVENEFGSVAKAGVYCNRLVIVDRVRDGRSGNRWDVGLEGELISQDGGLTITRINWANGTFWSRYR